MDAMQALVVKADQIAREITMTATDVKLGDIRGDMFQDIVGRELLEDKMSPKHLLAVLIIQELAEGITVFADEIAGVSHD